jgi:hypothetical protein
MDDFIGDSGVLTPSQLSVAGTVAVGPVGIVAQMVVPVSYR